MDDSFAYPRAINRLPVALRELWVSTFQDFYDPDAPSAAYKAAWGAVRAVSKKKERGKMDAFDQQRVGAWLRADPQAEADSTQKAEIGEQEAKRKAQRARAAKYHIRPHEGGNVTKPDEWALLNSEQFGDPVNYKYPIHDEAHVTAAIAYFNQEGQREQGGYTTAEWAILGKRIASRRAGKTFRGGKIVDSEEKMSEDETGVMQKPYPHEHAARVRDPGDFQPDSFRSKEITAGVRMILGKLKGATAMTTQSLRFDAEQFSAAAARAWLKEHKISVQSFEAATGEDDAEDTEEKALTPPAFVALKVLDQPDGGTRWLTISSGGFEDRDREVVSTAFLNSCVKSAQETKFRGPLLVQHIPGSNIGTCDMQAVVGEPGFLVESGPFDATPDGQRAAAYYRECAQEYGTSIKFAYVNRTGDGVYLPPGVIIERSLLPRARAAFPWSAIQLQEVSAMSATKEAREELARVLGDARADEILAQLESSAQALKEAGVRWKEQAAVPQEAEPVTAAVVEQEKTVAPVTESGGAAPAEMPETDATSIEKTAVVAVSADENQSMEVVLPDAVIDAVAQKAFERVTGRLDEATQVFAGLTQQLAEMSAVVKRMGAELAQLQKAEDERIEEKVRQLPRATVKMIQRPTQTNQAIEVPTDPAQGNDLLKRGLATLYGTR